MMDGLLATIGFANPRALWLAPAAVLAVALFYARRVRRRREPTATAAVWRIEFAVRP